MGRNIGFLPWLFLSPKRASPAYGKDGARRKKMRIWLSVVFAILFAACGIEGYQVPQEGSPTAKTGSYLQATLCNEVTLPEEGSFVDAAVVGANLYVAGYAPRWTVAGYTTDYTLRWAVQQRPEYDSYALAVTASPSTVYAAGAIGSSWVVEARGATNGALLWEKRRDYPDGFRKALATVVDGSTLFVVGSEGNACLVEARDTTTGNLTWERRPSLGYAIAVAVDGSNLYVVGQDSGQGYIAIFRKSDGVLIDVFPLPFYAVYSVSGQHLLGTVAEAGSYSGRMAKFDLTGALLWTVNTGPAWANSWSSYANLTAMAGSLYTAGYSSDTHADPLLQWFIDKRDPASGALVDGYVGRFAGYHKVESLAVASDGSIHFVGKSGRNPWLAKVCW